MNSTKPLRAIAVALTLLISILVFGQGHTEGDALTSYLGKGIDNQEFINLKNDYKLDMVNESHYLSNSGIELILKNGLVNEINLYKTSTVYGNFMGKLPHGLAFSMTSANVKGLLGKPTVAYSSGYSEFALKDCIIACWFDGDRLSQVGLSAKGSN